MCAPFVVVQPFHDAGASNVYESPVTTVVATVPDPPQPAMIRASPRTGKDERMNKTKDKVADAAGTVKPYVQRAISDEDLRDNVKAAFQAAREIYDELIGNRGVTTVATRLATDKEIQDKLREAVDELREAADRVQGKKDHGGRKAMLLTLGIALGILFNPLTGPA